jgi:hypothetical protein
MEVGAIQSTIEDVAAALAKLTTAASKGMLAMIESVQAALADHAITIGAIEKVAPRTEPRKPRRRALRGHHNQAKSPKSASPPALLSIDHPASGVTLRPGPIMPALVAAAAEVALAEPADNNPNHWEMHLKLCFDMPTTASHTIHLRPARCRRSEWMDLAQERSGLRWALNREVGHIFCHGLEYGLCITNTQVIGRVGSLDVTHESRYAVRIPRSMLAPSLIRALADAAKLGLPFAPEPVFSAPP